MIKSPIISLIKKQEGSILPLVAISMTILLSISALVIDVGALYLEKSRVQKAVDAAVLAGAQSLPSVERAREVALTTASKNNLTLNKEDINLTATSIEIKALKERELYFARILGFSTADVVAKARAEKGDTITGGSGFLPIVVVEQAFTKGQRIDLTSPAGNGERGNYGYIDFPDANLAYYITNGYNGYLAVGEKFFTATGNRTSSIHVRDAINGRINRDISKLHCQNYLTADNSCEKLIYIPMVDTIKVSGSSEKVTIVGFAAFLLTDNEIRPSNDNIIRGYFVDSIFPGDVGTSTKSFGLTSLKLVN